MRAAVIAAPGCVRIEQVARPEPGPGQVLVRLEGCGVCGSNLPVWEGREWFKYPLEPGNPGHEGYGTVEEIGEGVSGVRAGDRVGVLSYHAFAEFDIAESADVVPLPQGMAGPFPAEALGCAVNVMRRSGIQAGHVVAIVGVGFLGALIAQMAARRGARVIAISRRTSALSAARLIAHAETVELNGTQPVVDEVKERTGGKFCDVVIEAAGAQATLDLSGELTRERGRLVIAGFHQDGQRQVNMFLWNWRGIDVINAHERDPKTYVEGMRLASEMLERGELDPSPLYTHEFPLEKLADALNAAKHRPEGFMKAIVRIYP